MGLFVVLVSSAVLLSCFGPLFFFIAFPLSRFFRKPQANVIAFFGMPEVLLRELIELRVPSSEWTVALWGRAMSSRDRRLSSYLALLGIVLIAAYAFALLPDRLSMLGATLHASAAYLLGLRFGVTLAGMNGPAQVFLPVLLQRVRRFRRATLVANNPLGWLYAIALVVGVMLIWLLLALILSVMAASFRTFFEGSLEAMTGEIWFLPLSTVLFPLAAGLLTGALLVLNRSRTASARANEYLEALNEEVGGMLKMMQSRFDFEGDERPDIPRLNFRPSGAAPPKRGGGSAGSASGVSTPEGEPS